jgi:hypothetical protein
MKWERERERMRGREVLDTSEAAKIHKFYNKNSLVAHCVLVFFPHISHSLSF